MSKSKDYELLTLKFLNLFPYIEKPANIKSKPSIIKKSKFPKTKKQKKIDILSEKLAILKNKPTDVQNFKSFKPYLEDKNEGKAKKCQNPSCLSLNFEKLNINESLIDLERQYVELNNNFPIHYHNTEKVSIALTFYLHEALKDISSIDLVKNQYKLRIMSYFLSRLDKYVTFEIKNNRELLKYYLELCEKVKKRGNIAAYNCLLNSIKSFDLKIPEIEKINKIEEIYPNKVTVCCIKDLLIEINQTDSEKFCDIIEYFIEIQDLEVEKGDEDVENDIVECVEKFLDYEYENEAEFSYFLFLFD